MITDPFSLLVLRLMLGASLLGHGLVRLPKIAAFSDWMTGRFSKSLLPMPAVSAFAHALPFIEAGLGALLVLGLARRPVLRASGLLMVALIFGCTTIEEWEGIPSQMIHGALAAVLLASLPHDLWALDRPVAARLAR